jgi:putative heme-binding domain-containing protein
MTPALRVQTLEAFVQRHDRAGKLLDALAAGKVRPGDIDASRRKQLLESSDEPVRTRAAKIFAGAVNPDRQKVIDQYANALIQKGDPARGKVFFTAICATCHKVGDVGVDVGPNLLSLADRSPRYYLLHVLDPNRAVEARYTNYVVETKKGQVLSGVLSGETGTSVSLTGAGGKPQTVLRTDIKRMRATAVSVMPDGLEVGKTPQDFADLFAFLAADGKVPAEKK